MDYQNTITPRQIGQYLVLPIAEKISRQLPSRGLVMVAGQLNNQSLVMPLEPDGRGSHFLSLDESLAKKYAVSAGQPVAFQFSVTQDWPEPSLPQALIQQLEDNQLMPTWHSLSVRARWEWLRWIRSTKNSATRDKRIGVAMSKLSHGDRRPCCFNSASCTIAEIAKSGVLLTEEE